MNLDWIVTPLVQYALLGAGLLVCLALFVSSKLEVAAVRRSAEQSDGSLAVQLKEMESAMARMQEKVIEIEERPAPALGPALNLTRRTQALRMHRRGESLETIAGALGAPRNEVELLLKLQDILPKNV